MTTPPLTPYTPASPMPVMVPGSIPDLPPLGNDTVTITKMVRDPNGQRDSAGEILPTPTPVDVKNCRHRPIPATTPTQRETPEDITDIGTQVWQTHLPPLDVVKQAGITGRITVDGITYQILGGVAGVTDAEGVLLFYKILSKVQEG